MSAAAHTGVRNAVRSLVDGQTLRLILVLSLASSAIHFFGLLPVNADLTAVQFAEYALGILAETLVGVTAIVAVLKATAVLHPSGWRGALLTVGAGLLPMVLAVVPYFFRWPFTTVGMKYGPPAAPLALLLYVGWLGVVLAFAARAWLSRRIEVEETGRILAELIAAQETARRRLIQSRLGSLQARVDPAFLFDVLEGIRTEYSHDLDRGERILDELVSFLRASLPSLSASASTLERECRLAQSHACLRRLLGSSCAFIRVELEGDAGRASFPPGVLPPLAGELQDRLAPEVLVRGSVERSGGEGPKLRLEISGAGQPPVDALERAGSTLRDLFGNAAAVTPTPAGGVVLRMPFEVSSG